MNDVVQQLQEEFERRKITPFNINEHLQTLRDLADQCDHVTEIGVETGFSSSAHLSSKARNILMMDVTSTPQAEALVELARAAGKVVEYRIGDSLASDPHDTDYLFVDGWHSYAQVRAELFRFGPRVRKFIALHDTVLYADSDQEVYHGGHIWDTPLRPAGLKKAIAEFLAAHPDWRVRAFFTHQNGLTVLERA